MRYLTSLRIINDSIGLHMTGITGTGNTHLVTSYNDNFLSREQLLGYNTGETTEKVVSNIDDLGI
jgi:hypothetical protein